MKTKLSFEPQAMKALKVMQQSRKSLYLTGKAGSGKSTLINYFLEKTDKDIVLLGSTGIAAQNIGGKTLHSFFGIIPGVTTPRMQKKNMERFRKCDMVVIDESSMLRADDFDKMDKLGKKIMNIDDAPFGGKQFIFVGDLYQLPPVPEKDPYKRREYDAKYSGLFFFYAKSYDAKYFELVELTKVYRQNNQEFVNVLNQLRIGGKDSEIVAYLNKRVVKSELDLHPQSIYVATTNKIVFQKNKKELDKLPGRYVVSEAIIRGAYDKDNYPTDEKMFMKEGARVMFSVNHKDGEYVNGTLGTIEKIAMDGQQVLYVRILKDDGEISTVMRHSWLNMRDDDEDEDDPDMQYEDENPVDDEKSDVIGSFNQLPFKVAFAITIHKSQGKTFEHIAIDLGRGAFADGQVYVALSRSTTYEGIQLMQSINKKDIKSSREVARYMMGISG